MENPIVPLHVAGTGNENTVMMIHGFTGSHESMSELCGLIPRKCVSPDLIGHGMSPCPDDTKQYRLESMVDQLNEVTKKTMRQPFSLIGYSMGARLALTYAMASQAMVSCLVLISGTAGIQDELERHERLIRDSSIASDIEVHGMQHFVNYWERQPIFTSQRSLSAEKKQAMRRIRLSQRPKGLANHLRMAGTGAMVPLWDYLERLEIPVLLIVGEEDTKFMHIAERMKARLPDAALETIGNAGHAVHYEKPRETAASIIQFLDRRQIR